MAHPFRFFHRSHRYAALAACVALSARGVAQADVLDMAGVRVLWTTQPSLTGTGMYVAQAEFTTIDQSDPNNPVDKNNFEVNPAGDPSPPILDYFNSTGAFAIYSPAHFPNGVGTESMHADMVAENFYLNAPNPFGFQAPAPDITQVQNYNANYFVSNVIEAYLAVSATVVNQSFTLTSDMPDILLQAYDNYVDIYNTVIVTAGGNSGQIQLPGTAYNVITVSAYAEPVSVGTPDGRSKPDITAPGGATSYSTPVVSGVATLLVQAGQSGLGGLGTQGDATDNRTIKALLLNGATKTPGWSHTDTTPLDPVNGAGVVNANASVRNLIAGEFKPGGPVLLPATGWNLQTITSSASADASDIYPLSVQIGTGKAFFTATLVWNRPIHDTSDGAVTGINNLDLFLVNTATNTTVAQSISQIDNVEQIYFPSITPGTYDLEVLKHQGSAGNPNWVSDSETYALAWSTSLVGDANMDGTVNNADLVTLFNHFGDTNATLPMGDYDGNFTVNNADLVALFNNFGTSIGTSLLTPATGSFKLAAAVPTPEPTGLALLAVGSLVLLRRRRASIPC